jgi:hypothetical protein
MAQPCSHIGKGKRRARAARIGTGTAAPPPTQPTCGTWNWPFPRSQMRTVGHSLWVPIGFRAPSLDPRRGLRCVRGDLRVETASSLFTRALAVRTCFSDGVDSHTPLDGRKQVAMHKAVLMLAALALLVGAPAAAAPAANTAIVIGAGERCGLLRCRRALQCRRRNSNQGGAPARLRDASRHGSPPPPLFRQAYRASRPPPTWRPRATP